MSQEAPPRKTKIVVTIGPSSRSEQVRGGQTPACLHACCPRFDQGGAAWKGFCVFP